MPGVKAFVSMVSVLVWPAWVVALYREILFLPSMEYRIRLDSWVTGVVKVKVMASVAGFG